MSPASSAAVRPVPARPARAGAGRTPLQIVPARPSRPGRVPFVLLVVGVLSAGLAGLLGLNTALAQGSFSLSELQQQAAELEDRSEQLEQRLARAAAPEQLAAEARRIGMVPAEEVGFLVLAEGTVTGRPKAAPGAPPPLTEADRAQIEARDAAAEAAAAERAEARRLAAEQRAAQQKAEQERLAAERAAAAAEAARRKAEQEWQERLREQSESGPRGGGEQVLEPPARG